MSRHLRTIRSLRAIASFALVGIGFLSLSESLSAAIAWLNRVSSASAEMPKSLSLLLAAGQIVEAIAGHRQSAVYVFQHTLATSWPLLLVVSGTVLSWDTLGSESREPRE